MCRIFTNFMVLKQKKQKILNDMAKVAIKYDNIVPYSDFFMR